MPPPTLTLPGLDSEVSNSCPQNRSLSDKTDTGNTGEKEATKELKSKTASVSHQRQASFISEDKPKIFGATGSDVNEACSENTVLYKFTNGSCENLSKVTGEENILKSNIWPLECCEEHCDLAWSSQAESVAYRQGQSNCPSNYNTPNSNSPEYNTLETRNGLYYEEVIKGESDILPSYPPPLSKTDSNDKRKLFDCAIATSNEINYSQGYRFAYPSTDNDISSFTEADSGAIAKPDYSDVSQPILQTSCEYYPLSKVNNNHNSAGIKSEEEFLLPSSMACASTLTEGRMHNTPLVVSKPHYITSTDNVHLATRRKVCDHFPDSVSVPFPRFASRVQPSLQDKTQNLPNNLRESQSFKLYIQTFTQCELECPTPGAFKFMNAPSSHTTSSLPDFYTQDPEQNNYYDPHGSNNSFSRVAHQNQAYFDENDHANNFRCNARACDNKFCSTGNMEEKTTAESSINQNESKLEGIDLYEENNSNTTIGDNFGQSSSQSNVINPSQCFSAHSPVINPYHTEHRPYFVREQSQTSIFIDCPYKSGGLDVNSRGSLNNEHDWNFSSKSCTSDVRHADEMNLHPMQFTNSSIDQGNYCRCLLSPLGITANDVTAIS
ncbi:unnamed protein product [Clavelina lepadiformis]|uniref:Uncharacterized protein n=1 Tax=Clavelina lepadiformis TaxID=159417 RepID=A0ABP0G8R8_CLALP